MHTLLALSSVLLVLLGGYVALHILRRQGVAVRRRDLQFLVLSAPVVSLGLGIGGLHHFAGRTCLIGAPSWDYILGVALPLLMGLTAVGGLGLGLIRLLLLYRVVARASIPATAELQARVLQIADRVGVSRPRVQLCAYNRPLALTCGLWRPTVILSTWMIEHLDQREREAVLAHELAHVARRDYLVIWLATVLRDAFFYLPTSWAAYRQLQIEKEPACDDLAVTATKRPLALASALAKVWQQSVNVPSFTAAQPLTGEGESIEHRIERLLAAPAPVQGNSGTNAQSRLLAVTVGASALGVLLTLQAVNVAVMLAPMGCGPATLIGRLL